MKQEDKELLLRDLCSRLPYGVILNCCDSIGEKLIAIDEKGLVNYDYDINEVKPYLFPLFSMTDEQKQEYQYITERWMYDSSYSISDSIDWLNAHHFDYRDLITQGLAIDASNLNIY
jgi:hypothetical protein